MYRFFRYLAELTPNSKPSFLTPSQWVYETDAIKLRHFTGSRYGVPILIIGPQAGHHTSIVDYEPPDRSLVQLCIKETKRPVYAIEWKSATYRRARESLKDLDRQIDQCVRVIGGEAFILGLCQGGWASAIYAARHPQNVAGLILGGAPIDFKAGGGAIQEMVTWLPYSFYVWLVMLGGGIMRGDFIVAGFKNMHAYDRYIGDNIKLYQNIDDPKYVSRVKRFRQWYDYTQNIAGNWYLQVVWHLFKKNDLIHKRLSMDGETIDLSNINCPVSMIAGEKDDITLPPQIFNLDKHLGPQCDKIKFLVPDCGHIGLFIKEQALQTAWKPSLKFIGA